MTYTLAIGDRTYSSWSLRGWLLFGAFDIPVKTELLPMKTPAFAAGLEPYAPARLVPALRFDDTVVWDTLAIAETLSERHPDAGYWPSDPAQRALARSITAEMHSGFTALRSACPMVLSHKWAGFDASAAVIADLARIEALWGACPNTDWLFGGYSVVDAFYAPVAMRIAGYGLPVSATAQAYVDKHLAHQPFRQWRAMGAAEHSALSVYELGYVKEAWPGPTPIEAMVEIGGTPLNETCPFSGGPVQRDSLARIEGQIVGFCNRFCRDKVVADPEAWPEVMALLKG
ncbi:MAG: glutathione S-transferase family protein [Pseudomonadota bacterium]